MKYIKRYNESKNEKDMEDLEDYLQEIFDKYNIEKYEIGKNPNKNFYWIKSTNGYSQLIIELIDNKNHIKIYDDILSIRKVIENRLSKKIIIGSYFSSLIISIDI